MELFTCTQSEREPVRDFWRRFVQLRARTPDITDDVVILAAVNGVRPGPCSLRLTRKPPKNIVELHEVMEKYGRADTVFWSMMAGKRVAMSRLRVSRDKFGFG